MTCSPYNPDLNLKLNSKPNLNIKSWPLRKLEPVKLFSQWQTYRYTYTHICYLLEDEERGEGSGNVQFDEVQTGLSVGQRRSSI